MSQAVNKEEESLFAAKCGTKCSEELQVKSETQTGSRGIHHLGREVRQEKTLN